MKPFMSGELTKKIAVVQHESFMLHNMKLFWHPSVLQSFLLLNTQFFTVYHWKEHKNGQKCKI
jgi:hypothetical protein